MGDRGIGERGAGWEEGLMLGPRPRGKECMAELLSGEVLAASLRTRHMPKKGWGGAG